MPSIVVPPVSGSLVLNVQLAPALVDKIRRAAGDLRVVTRAELGDQPGALAQAEVLFTQHIDPARVAGAQSLRWVQTYSAGVEWLLSDAVIARDELRITNSRGIHAQPIAEHVFGLILAHSRRIDGAIRQQQTAAWRPSELIPTLRSLQGKTLGIIGLGAIGQRIAQLAQAFGLRVIGTRSSGAETPHVDRTYGPAGLPEVVGQSDYILNALPLTPETHHAFDRQTLAHARADAVFINIGRGKTVDTDALVAALEAGKLGAALLDVTEPEPLPPEHALWRLPNVIITPHYAGAHPEYGEHVTDLFLDNLERYRSGGALANLVDKRAGY